MLHRRIRWSGERDARLGYLMGLGWTAAQIAADPIVQASEKAIRARAERLDLRFREAPITLCGPDVLSLFEREAHRYAMTGRQLMAEVFSVFGREPNLIHGVVDIKGGRP